MKLKTFLIPINQGFVARYFLQTDIFKTLQASGNRIIVLVPNPDDNFYEPFNQYDNVIFERYNIDKCQEYMRKTPLERWLKLVRFYVLNGRYDIQTAKDHYQIFLDDYTKVFTSVLGRIRLFVLHCQVMLSRRSKVLRKLILWIERVFFSPSLHKDIFEKYQPDLLITSSMGILDYDQFLLREACRYNIKTVAVILSWDNTTTKGMPGYIPDHVVAWTENMKKELIELNDVPANKIFVGGVAHYDHYCRAESFMEKDIFCKHMGLEKNKKLLFFVAKSPNGYPYNMDICRIIMEAIREKKFSAPAQLLVRLHPVYFRKTNGMFVFQNFIDQFYDLKKKYSELILNEPDIHSQGLKYSMPQEEIKVLASILKYSDVVINMFSSVNVEASVFDRPIVNVCFEGDSYKAPKKARYNISIDEAQTHNQRILRTKGVQVAYNPRELIDYIDQYLINPEKDRQGRLQIRTNEAGPNLGQAGKTIAEHILSL
ncbi:MAG: hypothetical protein FVQ85_04125 [Planctomycetes bacterium]|nr:hypothetical protein [Planctomycetota bacterium]